MSETGPTTEISPEDQARVDEHLKFVSDFNNSLASKGTLFLVVELSTPEEADQLMQWMYNPANQSMKSKLVQIDWNKALIPKAQADAIEALRQTL